ncbi:MAG: hypothetical protein HY689_09450 [Chloroflexi bacterium]|nr:hypothetical protein [Chloroflexota bacterium]
MGGRYLALRALDSGDDIAGAHLFPLGSERTELRFGYFPPAKEYVQRVVTAIVARWAEAGPVDATAPKVQPTKTLAAYTREDIRVAYAELTDDLYAENGRRPTQKDLANRLHVSESTLERHRKAIGEPWPPRLPQKTEDARQIAAG